LQFESELSLENFVWANLKDLFHLKPLERQYRLDTEIRDIIAVDFDGRLHILELKNEVDRYVIQQLTRYYDVLTAHRPFKESVDYSKPVKLIAIAPKFHRHNHIDLKYNILNIDLLQFEIKGEISKPELILKNLETEEIFKASLPVPQENTDTELSSSSPDLRKQRLLDYYILSRYTHKLGIEHLTKDELEKFSSRKIPKGSKVFKIELKVDGSELKLKQLSIRVPSSITGRDFYVWLTQNVPTIYRYRFNGGWWPVSYEGKS
jgi:Endonuclease NucS